MFLSDLQRWIFLLWHAVRETKAGGVKQPALMAKAGLCLPEKMRGCGAFHFYTILNNLCTALVIEINNFTNYIPLHSMLHVFHFK